ncbi:hypothetical protein [Aquiluna sp. KACHI24]|uniref:hypothetical protein n=1 Tax=Aquiluna sp. KACHI24 TaxID=2968831 RepID=UPI0022096827|nr:hypothetical protein [Aquiluna sp. KACHI24]BDQ00943.1 hypothetical protein AKACHI_12790 [Aquiluna sp. KACHI24]
MSEISAKDWASEFGITQVLFATDDGKVPADLGWDPKLVWTGWDSYDEVGGYAEPGLTMPDEVVGERFVSCWYLGSKPWSESDIDYVETLERESCESCETDGCEECDELGWIETNLLEDCDIRELS